MIKQELKEMPLKDLNNLLKGVLKEIRIRNARHDLDLTALKSFIHTKFPMVTEHKRKPLIVAYKSGVSIVLTEFISHYKNLSVEEISKIVGRHRTCVYHYLTMKENLHLPGFEIYLEAYEQAKQELIIIIKSGKFDLK